MRALIRELETDLGKEMYVDKDKTVKNLTIGEEAMEVMIALFLAEKAVEFDEFMRAKGFDPSGLSSFFVWMEHRLMRLSQMKRLTGAVGAEDEEVIRQGLRLSSFGKANPDRCR